MEIAIPKKYQKIIIALVLASLAAGIGMRFFEITKNEFFFYDEGYYLNYNRKLLDVLDAHRPFRGGDLGKAVYSFLRVSLATGKTLWFLIVDSRVFWGALKWWSFPRVISAVAGSLTLFFVYFFSKKFYDSKSVGVLTLILLAFLPGHVFYSRLALQEAISALFFLLGFYFYLFPRKFGCRTFISSVFFVCVFFTNYRLIIIPVLVAFTELYMGFARGQTPSFRKYLWNTLIFVFLIFFIGNLDQAQNTITTFSWMFHQADIAKERMQIVNFLSYPYYVFKLENILFGFAFFANMYYFFKREWSKAYPFALVAVLMAIFSFAGDKGVRYLCVGLPFMAMAVASFFVYLWNMRMEKEWRSGIGAIALIMTLGLAINSVKIARLGSDYKEATQDILAMDPTAKILSSQNWVQSLYMDDRYDAVALPQNYRMFVRLHRFGYNYMVIGPQAYVSYTHNRKKFDPELIGHLEFIVRTMKPVKVYPHFNDILLERFVLEHNENLLQSIRFLNDQKKDFGKLRVYDVEESMRRIRLGLKMIEQKRQEEGAAK